MEYKMNKTNYDSNKESNVDVYDNGTSALYSDLKKINDVYIHKNDFKTDLYETRINGMKKSTIDRLVNGVNQAAAIKYTPIIQPPRKS